MLHCATLSLYSAYTQPILSLAYTQPTLSLYSAYTQQHTQPTSAYTQQQQLSRVLCQDEEKVGHDFERYDTDGDQLCCLCSLATEPIAISVVSLTTTVAAVVAAVVAVPGGCCGGHAWWLLWWLLTEWLLTEWLLTGGEMQVGHRLCVGRHAKGEPSQVAS